MPPCAATVCERVGKHLGDAGGPQSRLRAADHGAQARAAGAHHHHVEGVILDRIGAPFTAGAPFGLLPLPWHPWPSHSE